MLGKILSHLLGGAVDELETAEDTVEDMMEFEEGGWVIVNLPEDGQLPVPEVDPLENLLIEHPSMSVYQFRHRVSGAEEEEASSEEEEDLPSSSEAAPLLASGSLGVPLPCNLQLLSVQSMQRAKTQGERKKLSRSALHRQNMAKTRFSAAERRYGHFKQPCQRLYNY